MFNRLKNLREENERLKKALRVIINNRPGAAHRIAIQALAKTKTA